MQARDVVIGDLRRSAKRRDPRLAATVLDLPRREWAATLSSCRAVSSRSDFPTCARLPSLADGAVSSSAGGPLRLGGTPCRSRAQAARDCSPPSNLPSWAAVFGAISSRRREANLSAAHGLTAVPTHNHPRSAGRAASSPSTDPHTLTGAAPPADLVAVIAVDLPFLTAAPGTTATASSLPAHSTLPNPAQGASGGEDHSQPSAVPTHTRPAAAHRGRPPTPACTGHRPSTLDSQEGR